ncbi:predicted protein [Pyrenophora tritici-repentis Pt-1C-BFP]|uniref:Uncharacterized protein n=1 Tax=Pyrenophora tritici-repentis (strain Pt-1C-BFP) TaxID=426418 RepID=B2WIK3_PYRTR|nr:uncharacterized protein PTRG_09812 [Pyrenophora tritici-repentis Pt-1C-BFP]EDU42863.1 predicted protein [Pyrenophora tritici-repentis Pt-1C-BFP]
MAPELLAPHRHVAAPHAAKPSAPVYWCASIRNLYTSSYAMTAPSLLSRNGHVIPALLPPDPSLPSTQTNLIPEHRDHGPFSCFFVVIVTWTAFAGLTWQRHKTAESRCGTLPFLPFLTTTASDVDVDVDANADADVLSRLDPQSRTRATFCMSSANH